MPEKYIKEYQNLVRDFIWDGKPSKIKYTCLINKHEYGGLQLQDINSKIKALKTMWYKKIIDTDYTSPWKTYMQSKLKIKFDDLLYCNLTYNDMPHFHDNFYNDLLDTWCKMHGTEPKDAESVCKQILWHNNYIRVNGKTISYKNWIDHNIIHIQDIIGPDGKILPKAEIATKFDITMLPMQYESLQHAIPKKWKHKLNENAKLNLNYYVFKDCTLTIDNMTRKLIELSTKQIYWHLVSTLCHRPTSETKWNEKLNFHIDQDMWNLIYVNSNHLTHDTSIMNMQFKITHRIIACNYNLKIWKIKETNTCNNCNDIDTIEHFFVECPTTYIFWKYIFNWWAYTMHAYFHVDTYEILFGIPNERKEIVVSHINYIILHAKFYIYQNKKKQQNLDPYEFLLDCKNSLMIKNEIMTTNGKAKLFDKLWSELYDNI
jgi:hypothetical protein